MAEFRHILITGNVGVGKSTLIRKLLAHFPGPAGGFITLKMAEPGADTWPLYMFPAAQPVEERRCTEENLLGIRGAVVEHHPEKFDTLGVDLIRSAGSGGVILMDELGFMEAEAKVFQAAVLEALRGDIPVIASVKNKPGVPFLDAVRNSPGTVTYTVTRENRDTLEQEILEKEAAFFRPRLFS